MRVTRPLWCQNNECIFCRETVKIWWWKPETVSIFISFINQPLTAGYFDYPGISFCTNLSCLIKTDANTSHAPDMFLFPRAKGDLRHVPGQAELHGVPAMSGHRAADSQSRRHFLSFCRGRTGSFREGDRNQIDPHLSSPSQRHMLTSKLHREKKIHLKWKLSQWDLFGNHYRNPSIP